MQIGRYSVEIIETCRFGLDGGAMFGVVPKNLWAKAYPHVDEQNRIAMSARALLIRGEGRTIVVDSGCGEKMGAKLEAIYAIDNSRFTLAGELAMRGVSPLDVTHFIYTHLHFDHAGGSTRFDESGHAVPTFPNARHYVQRDHVRWAENPTDKDRASFMPENWTPVAERGLLEEVDGGGEILPAIEVRPVHGHTRAMQMVIIHAEAAAGPAGLAYCADLIPTSAHLPFPYVMGYDNFPLTTLEEKKAFIPEAFERGWLLAFEHDAFAQAARIAPHGKGFAIQEMVEL
ncbi:MAG: MBL fold metallo-hydrolase [Bacteroidetes bacterium]|nr:MBL fold metallo-hydrolase [Bacteroidota bacterium]